ncbi:MAG: hypothetical protein IJU61_04010 [Victivallales bacterium]|nr:hypothetical protein [Victivallales bacterium]
MSFLDWSIVAIPLIAIVFIGVLAQHYTNNVAGFLAAGRKAGRYLLTVADGTAGMGLITVVAQCESKYRSGYAIEFWGNLTFALTLLMTLTGFVIYRYRETRVLTMAEFYEKRYNRSFRIFAGSTAFISGLINYALFPAVAGRFVIYYCHLPQIVTICGIHFKTFGLLMAIFLGIALFIVLAGGQITTMVTDCCQGIFAYFGYTAIVVALLCIFSVADVRDAVLSRPEGESFFNPFNVDKLTQFNLLYIIIGMIGAIYNRNAWLGNQAYYCSAANPHEQKMAGVLGQWRAGFMGIALMLMVIGAYTYMNSSHYATHAAAVHQEIHEMVQEEFPLPEGVTESDVKALAEDKAAESTPAAQQLKKTLTTRETIGNQMLVPVALRHILPIGVTGTFMALMIFLMVSTDTTYLHSWGTILIQDVVLPIYHKPISQTAQLRLLRIAISFVAVFAWWFSYYFSQSDYILQFFALTGTIYLGGAGACMLGGLYTRRGTTAGAFTAMIVGLFFAILGFGINQKWVDVHNWLATNFPNFLENFRLSLAYLGDKLTIVNWEVAPEKFARKFPITGQEIYLLGMVSAILGYVIVSWLTCKKPYNLDKLLHRGEYNLEHFVDKEADKSVIESAKEKKFNWKSLLGITPEYSKGDRILAWSVVIWSFYNFFFFLVEAIWNLKPAWRWTEATWTNIWIFYSLPLSLLVGIVTTVWFTWGSSRDLYRLLKSLKEAQNTTDNEDGQVKDDEKAN